MANLLDTIKQNQAAVTAQPGVEDNTQNVAGLLRAKSGKAVGGGPVAASNLGEQAAVANTGAQLNQVQQQANVVNEGQALDQARQEQQQRIQQQQIEHARKFDNVQTRMKTNNILSDLERNKGEIDVNKKNASLEEATFNLRMQNTQYIDNLQRAGAEARLDTQNGFDEALQTEIFGENTDLLKDRLGKASVLDTSEREWKTAMNSMTADRAWDVYQNEVKTEKQMAPYQVLSAGYAGGAGAYSAYENKQDRDQRTASANSTASNQYMANTSNANNPEPEE